MPENAAGPNSPNPATALTGSTVSSSSSTAGSSAAAIAQDQPATTASSPSPSPQGTASKSATSSLRSMKSTVRIPSSLQSARQMAAESAAMAEKEQSPERQVQQTTVLPDQAYSREQLMAAWQQYAEQLKAEGRQGEYIVLKETPELPGNHLVQVRISNTVQQDFFEKAKPGAQLFLRKALQNSQISLGFIVVKEEEGKRLYTAQEKFGYLIQKYPQLKELKERLGLEADF